MTVALNAAITLQNPSNPQVGQSNQNPCVIGDPSCKDGVLPPHTLIGTGLTSFDLYSPDYTVSMIAGVVGGNLFNMGLDLNNTNDPQTINSLGMYVNNNLIDSWTGPLTLKADSNGTGFSDVTFQGFSLAGFSGTDTVKFRLVMSNLNDGRENLFLIGGQGNGGGGEVPEPATFVLVGAGLAGVAMVRRRQAA